MGFHIFPLLFDAWVFCNIRFEARRSFVRVLGVKPLVVLSGPLCFRSAWHRLPVILNKTCRIGLCCLLSSDSGDLVRGSVGAVIRLALAGFRGCRGFLNIHFDYLSTYDGCRIVHIQVSIVRNCRDASYFPTAAGVIHRGKRYLKDDVHLQQRKKVTPLLEDPKGQSLALIMFTPSNIVPPLSVPRTRIADPPSFEPSARLSQASASQPPPPPPPRLPLDLLPDVLKFLHPHRLIHPLPLVSRAVRDHIRQHLIPSRAFAASNIALCGADINTVALSRFPPDSYWRAAVAVHGFTIDVADAVLRPPASAPAKRSRRLTDRPPVLTITSPSPAVRAAASLLAPIAVEWLQRRRQQSSTASSGGGTALLFPLQFAVAFTCAPILAAALPLPTCLCDDDTSNWTSVGGSYPALLRCRKPANGGPSSACPRAARLAENLLWTLVWARSSGGGFVDDEGDRELVVRSVVGALIGSYGRGRRRAAVALIRDAVEGATESGNRRVAVALKGALRELDVTEEGGAGH
ncbi:hypothetical protein DFJ73DRAFT_798842 [Zopfochytrium polystomum]|nr:hypothetical protein DFJ73DRAFT_798842 [Zopfochytrium polystomum]